MSDVFISHSSKDKEIADKVCGFLEENKISCWIAPRNIVPGSDWANSINEAITATRIFLIIFSENSAKSHQVAREVALAENRDNVFVLPYKIDDTALSGTFEYYLTDSHFIVANTAKEDYKFEELLKIIQTTLSGKKPEIHKNLDIDNKDTPSGSINRKKAGIIIILSLLSVILIISVVLIITSSNKTDTDSNRSAEITSAEPSHPDSSVSGNITDKKEKKGIVIAIYEHDSEFDYLVDYFGEFDEFGVPDGEGEFSGKGLEIKNGYTIHYTGNFKKGTLDGQGTLTISSNDGITIEYKGGFSKNQKSGKGILTETHENENVSKIIYDGTWENGDITTGTQTMYYLDGTIETYSGEFEYDTRKGKGTLLIEYKVGKIEKETVTGSWLYNDLHGENIKVVKYYRKGDYAEYIGQFEYGSFSGNDNTFIYHDVDGSRSENKGYFSEDEFVSGTITDYDTEGNIISTTPYEDDTPAFKRQADCRSSIIEYIEKNGESKEYPEGPAYYVQLPFSEEHFQTQVIVSKESAIPLKFECISKNNLKAVIEFNTEIKKYQIQVIKYDESGNELRRLDISPDISTFSGYIFEEEIVNKTGFDDYSLSDFIQNDVQEIFTVLNSDTSNFFDEKLPDVSWIELGFECW